MPGSYTWTVALPGDACGFCGEPIDAGAPMQEIRREGLKRVLKRVLKRCVDHRHTEVDWPQVDQARHAAELREQRRAIADPAAAAAPVHRITPVRPLKPFASMADLATTFDPRAAAAGRDE